MNLDAIRFFAINKLPWIKQQRAKMVAEERETPREYLERESHYVWGKRYLMKIVERDGAPTIQLKHSKLVLSIRPGTTEDKRQELVETSYRDQLRQAADSLRSGSPS